MKIRSSLLFAASLVLVGSACAQNATTTPVGAVTITIPAAVSGSAPSYSLVNIPLSEAPAVAGSISAVTATTVTLNATVSQTINSGNPYILRITSGSHAGRTFVVGSNSGSVLTVDNQGSPLDSLSPAIALGTDQCQLIPADTVSNIFGTLTQGNSTAAGADQVWIWSGGQYNKYYYNTTNSRWQDTVFGSDSSNVVIRPDSGVMFVRRAVSALSLVIPGVVRGTNTLARIQDSGYTVVSGGFPVDTTLGSIGLDSQTSWVKGTSAASADQVWIWSGGQYNKYYYNTTNARWQDTVFGSNSNSTTIPAGSAIMVKKAAVSGSTYATYNMPVPYTL